MKRWLVDHVDIVAPLAALVAILALTGAMYAWSSSDCSDRGGHTEIIWGGRGGWVCDGATR